MAKIAPSASLERVEKQDEMRLEDRMVEYMKTIESAGIDAPGEVLSEAVLQLLPTIHPEDIGLELVNKDTKLGWPWWRYPIEGV